MQVLINTVPKVQEFVSIVSKSNCEVDLQSGKSTFLDAKSLLGIMSCDISKPLKVEIFGDTEDQELLIENIKKFQN